MDPTIIGVKEAVRLSPAGQPVTVLIVTYTVGAFGPFTLQTNAADLQSGEALRQMRQFAASLASLPLTSQA